MGQPLVNWPPLFPTLAALPGLLRVEPWTAVRFLNACSFGIIVFICGFAFLRGLRFRSLAFTAAAALLVSHPLPAVAAMAWPEPLFCLLVVVVLLLLSRFIASDRPLDFVWLVLAAAAASLTHYAAVCLTLAGVPVLLAARRPRFSVRLARAAGFAAAVLVPLLVLVSRNRHLTGTVAGTRVPVVWQDFLRGILNVLHIWFIPPEPARWLGTVGIFPAALALACTAFLALRRVRGANNPWAWFVRANACWLVAYAAFLAYPPPPVNFDPIPDRMLVPAFISMVVVLFVCLDRLAETLGKMWTNRLLGELAVLAATLFWLAYPLGRMSSTFGNWMKKGTDGYNTTAWRESSFIRWFENNPPPSGTRLFSNDPMAVCFLAGLPAKLGPQRNESLGDLSQQLGNDTVYLVWFRSAEAKNLYTPEELGKGLGMTRTVNAPDAEVYAIWAGPGTPPRGSLQSSPLRNFTRQ